MSITIDYPEHADFRETVSATRLGRSEAVLDAHAMFLTLAPGDVVRLDEWGVVRDLVSLHPQWTLWVNFGCCDPHDPAYDERVGAAYLDDVLRAWRRDTYVTRYDTSSLLVSSTHASWLHERVTRMPGMDEFGLLRRPTLTLDWAEAVRRPALAEPEDPFA